MSEELIRNVRAIHDLERAIRIWNWYGIERSKESKQQHITKSRERP
jgi:hypothetical protein